MFHSVSFTLLSGGVERHIQIEPIWLQADLNEPAMFTGKYLIYEDLTPYEHMTDDQIEAFVEQTTVPSFDLESDRVYMGGISFNGSAANFVWEGKRSDFNEHEFKELAEYIYNYREPEIEDYLDNSIAQDDKVQIFFDGAALPDEDEEFTIEISVNGKNQECKVLKWGYSYEVQFEHSYIMLTEDENGNWRQTHGENLPSKLMNDIITKINQVRLNK